MENKLKREILNLTKKLIEFRTTADRPEELEKCADFIQNYLAHSSLKIRRYQKNKRPSLLVTLQGTPTPALLLNGHFDVVPAPDNLFTAKIKNNRLFGRGALDMKSQMAAMMVLVEQLAQRSPHLLVGLMLVGDEEIGGRDGTGYLLEKMNLKPEFVLAGEPTELKVGNKAKGVLRVKLVSKGKSAHAAKLWEGENAILSMVKNLANFQNVFPPPQKPTSLTTFNLSIIEGGDTLNKVPDRCKATFDIRYAPSDNPKKIVEKIQLLCSTTAVEMLTTEPAAFCTPNNEFVRKLQNAIKKITGKSGKLITKEAASDVRHFTARGIPGVVFGPSGGGTHADNEWVDLPSLFTFYRILEEFSYQ